MTDMFDTDMDNDIDNDGEATERNIELGEVKHSDTYTALLAQLYALLDDMSHERQFVTVLCDLNINHALDYTELPDDVVSNAIPSVHGEQPEPLMLLTLNMRQPAHAQFAENLLLHSCYEIDKIKSHDTEFGRSVCLWWLHTQPNCPVNVNSLYQLAQINNPTKRDKDERRRYLRYWDARVLAVLPYVLSAPQYELLYRYLAPESAQPMRLYMVDQLRMTWTQPQRAKNVQTPLTLRYDQRKLKDSYEVSPSQWEQLTKVGWIHALQPLLLEWYDDLLTDAYRDMSTDMSQLAPELLRQFARAQDHGFTTQADANVWCCISLTMHPRFYALPDIQPLLSEQQRAEHDSLAGCVADVTDSQWEQITQMYKHNPSHANNMTTEEQIKKVG